MMYHSTAIKLDKLIRPQQAGIELSLVTAIRRATGNPSRLKTLMGQVQSLQDTARSLGDPALLGCVGRLIDELEAAYGGKSRPMLMEYKHAAIALSSRDDRRRSDLKQKSGNMAVAGYGSTFGGRPDSYGDLIQSGAFSASLREHKAAGSMPKMLFSHDPSQIAGLWTSMDEDTHGLVVKGTLANTVLGRDLNELVEMGALDSLSIGFTIPSNGATYDAQGHRIIRTINLYEVSLVSMPANRSAQLDSAPRIGNTGGKNAVQQALDKLREQIAIDESTNITRLPLSHSSNEAAELDSEALQSLGNLLATLKRKP